MSSSQAGRVALLFFILLIPLIICIVILCALLYSFLVAKNDKSPIKVRALSVFGVLSFVVTLFCYYYAEQFVYDVFWSDESYAMVSFFWGHGNAATYLLFILRMNIVFGTTAYQSSKIVYIAFISMIIFVYLCQIYIVIFFLCVLDECVDAQIGFAHINIANAIEIVFQLILSVSLIIVFCRKLLRVTKNCVNDKLNTKFTSLATKITVLSSLGASTTVLWLFFAAMMDIDWIAYPNSSLRTKHALHFLTGIGLMLDCTVNSSVIFLSFGFSEPVYHKVCAVCHRACSKCSGASENAQKTAKQDETLRSAVIDSQ